MSAHAQHAPYQTDTSLTPRAQVRAALRSGAFPQAFGALEQPGEGYCCLGVACIIAEQNGVPVHRYRAEEFGHLTGDRLEYQPDVARWLLLGGRAQSWRINRNDHDRWPFAKIADVF